MAKAVLFFFHPLQTACSVYAPHDFQFFEQDSTLPTWIAFCLFLRQAFSTFLTTSVPLLGVVAPCLECLWWSALFSLFRLLFVGCCISYCVPIVSACLRTYWKFLPRLVLLRLRCSSWLFGPCHSDVFLWIRLAWCPFALIVGVTTWGCHRTTLRGQSSTSKRRSNELSRAHKIHFLIR